MSRAACGGEETRWGRGRGAGLTKKVKPGEGGGEERDGGWVQLPRNSIAPPGARDPDPRATRSSGIPTRFESPRDKRSGVQRLTPKSSHPCSHWPLDRAGEGGQSLCQPHPTCPSRPPSRQPGVGETQTVLTAPEHSARNLALALAQGAVVGPAAPQDSSPASTSSG